MGKKLRCRAQKITQNSLEMKWVIFLGCASVPFCYSPNPSTGQGLTSMVRVADAVLFAGALAVIVMTSPSPSPA